MNSSEITLDSLGKEFDIIIEGTGNAAVAIDSLKHLATNGVACFLGVYASSKLSFEAGDLFREMVLRNKLVFGSVNANKRYFEMGLKDFQKIKSGYGSLLSKLITETLKPEEYRKAFQPDSSEIKTVIDFS